MPRASIAAAKGLPGEAEFMAEVVGRVGSSSWAILASSRATTAPASPWPCSPISLPMDHMMMEGWLRSRRISARASCSCQSAKRR